MKILVNTRLLITNQLDGIGVFTYNVLKILTSKHTDVDFHFVFDRNPSDKFIFNKNVNYTVLSPQTRHPVLYYFWFEHRLPKVIRKIKPDLFLSPDGFLSLKSNVPSLPVIHDLNFEHYPDYLPIAYRIYYRKFFPEFAKKAKRIATVSEYSKNDIAKLYQIPGDQIDVVYNGTDDDFSPINNEKKVAVQKQFSEGNPYFLFVGTIHPRKNLLNLIAAFNRFKEVCPSPLQLLIAGRIKWPEDLKKAYTGSPFKKDIKFLGRINDEDLRNITASAFALTYIPFFEGFGIPVIDAMKCGVPVITSNTSSLPEISGDAALLANPHDANDICQKMISLYKNDQLRKELIKKGFQNVKKFNWEKTADLLWESIMKVL